MRKLRVYAATLFAALAFSLAAGPQASAQGMPTIDISNLVQNIMDYLETQLREGSLFDIAGAPQKMQDLKERYDAFVERIEDFQRIAALYKSARGAYDDIMAIAELGKLIAADVTSFTSLVTQLNTVAPYDMVIDATAFAQGFVKCAEIITKFVGDEMKEFVALKQTDPFQLLDKLHSLVMEMYGVYSQLSYTFRSHLLSAYYRVMEYNAAVANDNFRSVFFF